MRVSGGESICPPPIPAPTRADGKMGGALHCVDGWGWGTRYSKAILCSEKRGQSAFSLPEGRPHPKCGHLTQGIH